MSETETGYQERHEATVAELSRLRGVVEAVQAALEERITGSLGTADWAIVDGRQYASVNPDWLRAIVAEARSIRAALAPVSSSGEAGSGWVEDIDGNYKWTRPAPVPSGGQADGEGVRLSKAECDSLDQALEDSGCHGFLGDHPDLYAAAERIVAAHLAARPVLSREAVREQIISAQKAHPEAESEPGYNRWHCVGCGAALGTGRKARAREAFEAHVADAVLDVLAAEAGEQR